MVFSLVKRREGLRRRFVKKDLEVNNIFITFVFTRAE